MKTFDNEWIFQVFESLPSFFTRRMFGGLAAYAHGRQMLVLVEPTQTGRWNWHGVLICTDYAHQPAIMEEFPILKPHDVLKKWLYMDSRHEDFESTLEQIAQSMARNDVRFGIHPQPKKDRSAEPVRRRKR